MIVIKMMSGEDLADSDTAKGYRMVVVGDGGSFSFGHDESGKPFVEVTTHQYGYPESVTHYTPGNTYVISDSGKTIASFWGRSKAPYGSHTENTLSGGICKEEFKVGKALHIELDPRDPEPGATVGHVLGSVAFNDRKAKFAVQYADYNLTETQLMLLSEPPLKLRNNQDARDKAYRARAADFTRAGIPQEIAIEQSIYLLG